MIQYFSELKKVIFPKNQIAVKLIQMIDTNKIEEEALKKTQFECRQILLCRKLCRIQER